MATRNDFLNNAGNVLSTNILVADDLSFATSVSPVTIVQVNEDGTPKVGLVKVKRVTVVSEDLYFDATNYRAG